MARRSPATLLRIRNKELRQARAAISRLSKTPHFRLSELLAAVDKLREPGVRVGHMEPFRRLTRFQAEDRTFTIEGITERTFNVIKDVP
jgi:hypothetical protein